ncbi:hypothetical protein I302_106444 [Kwoniella bestiolae CBS 10118]|uniref:FAD dependent oxidoreductase domain-containing protein n=1 Tax=Kwoniella bestiolae CBS 10118 TaxID=1296100 RepID=A0A1B9G1F6_9TREE|nr:hypothetical protein I302_06299 [Kwoniella bestiolae CBS 10118]OCF24838.1 hypothetical protein I302_06299 [Kwoniella bestiolae CBS 10118]
MSLPTFPHPPSDRIAIIGSGIVGSHLASFLSHSLGSRIILVDKDIKGLPGSTGHAPGFVGQYNELPVLTELAKRSVSHYLSAGEEGFQKVGGLEIATNLEERAEAARKAGLESKLLNKQEILELVPSFLDGGYLSKEGNAGLYFPNDGTANAISLTHTAQNTAASNGAILLDAQVVSHQRSEDGKGWKVDTSLGEIQVGRLVYCTGIWASQLLPRLEHSVVSVSHPYSYSVPHPIREKKTPFIRWPKEHVYARDHGLKDGLGSYAHAPIKVPREEHGETAYGRWENNFDEILDKGYGLLDEGIAKTFKSEGTNKFNGLFSVTPDGLPLVGQVDEGLYCAVGVWVTHAAGSARLLADELVGEGGKEDAWLRSALDPKRFDKFVSEEEQKVLERRSLAKYNDIYNKEG